ncbi:hypothetical protein HDU81_007436 [Chytriomyces hyalinus]|nr:hypothetical protein HDU81_007436 [Chytriomyces hyalinus]
MHALIRASTRCFATSAASTNATFALRDYQQECIDKCLAALSQGVRRQAVSLPVGSGKTVIFSNLMKRVPVPEKCPTATKFLVLAHRTELLTQARDQIMRAMPDKMIILDQGTKKQTKETIESSDIVLASVPTLGNSKSDRFENYDPKQFKGIIIDEAHHASAASYKRLLDRFNALDEDSHIFVWGCSATLRRHDGRSLDTIFNSIVYHKSFLEMIQKNYLCDLRITTVKTKVSLDGVPLRGGEFATGPLAICINNPHRNSALLAAWKENAGNGQRKATIIFAVDVKHINDLVELFQKNGIDARGIAGQTKAAERQATVEAFRRGEFPVLINCGILTEGVDITRIDCVILGRPTRSGVLLQQMIGRGLRQHKGGDKQNCLVIDFADASSENDYGIHATMPTLMGLRPDFKIPEGVDLASNMELIQQKLTKSPQNATKARSLEELEELERKAKEQHCELTMNYTEFSISDLFDVDQQESENMVILRISKLAWVRLDKYACILSLRENQSILIDRMDDGRFVASFRVTLKRGKARIVNSQELLEHDSLTDSIRACDTWISDNMPEQVYFLKRNAPWRQKPATEAQNSFLLTKGMISPTQLITIGVASDMITKLVNGGKGRAARSGIAERKRAKLVAKVKKGSMFEELDGV